MLSKELAMEESMSISRDYNIDINTAMELVLESSLYDDGEDNVAMESLLGKSMRFGPRFLSGIKRFFSFIANAIRAMIAKLTKRDAKRMKMLGKIDNSIGSYIKRSAELIARDISKLCETCIQCVKDMVKTVDPIYKSLVKDQNSNASGDLSYDFKRDPEELKSGAEAINVRYTALRDYCNKMKDKYSEGNTKINFVDSSISEIIDKTTSDKLVDDLEFLLKNIDWLDGKIEKIQGTSRLFNKSQKVDTLGAPDPKKQTQFVDNWSRQSRDITSSMASAMVTMKSIVCPKGSLQVPAEFFTSNEKARAAAAATNTTQPPKPTPMQSSI